MLKITLDGGERATIAYPPYETSLGFAKAGKHKIDVAAYISRNNSFGTLHHADRFLPYNAPATWFSGGAEWTYEYRLREEGIISTPEIFVKK